MLDAARLLDRPYDEMVEAFRRFRASEGLAAHSATRRRWRWCASRTCSVAPASPGDMRSRVTAGGTSMAALRRCRSPRRGSPCTTPPSTSCGGTGSFYLGYQYERTKRPSGPPSLVITVRLRGVDRLLENETVLRALPCSSRAPPVARQSRTSRSRRTCSPGSIAPTDRFRMRTRGSCGITWARPTASSDRQEGRSVETRGAAEKSCCSSPCQYGGSHGVHLGCETTPKMGGGGSPGCWRVPLGAARVLCSAPHPEWASGSPRLYSTAASSRGEPFATSPSRLVSARQSVFIRNTFDK